jgi:hypothetical protein
MRSTDHRIVPGVAPSAARMPISGVRKVTTYAMTP